MNEIEFAKRMILNTLGQNLSPEALSDAYEISHGNNKILLEHITALIEIFNKAKEQMLAGDKNEWNNRRSNAWRAAESRAQ